MLALKRFVTIVVMVQLLLMLLFLLAPAVRSTLEGMDSGFTPTEKEKDFFQILTWISFAVLALQLLVENMNSALLNRTVTQHEGKINELKAKLYDHQQRENSPIITTTPPSSSTSGYSADNPIA